MALAASAVLLVVTLIPYTRKQFLSKLVKPQKQGRLNTTRNLKINLSLLILKRVPIFTLLRTEAVEVRLSQKEITRQWDLRFQARKNNFSL